MNKPSRLMATASDGQQQQQTPQMEMMAAARSRTSFDVEAMTCIIFEGEDTVRRRREAWARIEERLGASDTSVLPRQYAKTSREDLYLDGLALGRAAFDDRAKYGHDFFDWISPRYTRKHSPLTLLFEANTPTSHHDHVSGLLRYRSGLELTDTFSRSL